MKKVFLTFILIGLIALRAYADEPVSDQITEANTFNIAGDTDDIAGATDAIAGEDADLVGLLNYYVMYDQMAPIGDAGAMVPNYSVTSAARFQKMEQQLEAIRTEHEMQRDYLVKKATVVNLTPKYIWQQIKAMESGDVMKTMRDKLEDLWDDIQDKLSDTFSEQAMDMAVRNLVQDIMSCKTPNLQALFPNIDLNLGLQVCNYKQMFDNVKGQVENMAKKGWGGSFMINGQPISKIIQDPSMLMRAVRLVPPGQGHALVADFLAEDSMNIGLQANVDTTALGQKIASQLQSQNIKRMFKDYTINDALNDSIKIQATATQAQIENANAANQIAVDRMRLEQMRQDAQAHDDQTQHTANQASYGYGFSSGFFIP